MVMTANPCYSDIHGMAYSLVKAKSDSQHLKEVVQSLDGNDEQLLGIST